ncbi:MAG: MopE-related protein [Myxococcota bacterium]|nr:MopE-related protein [Myxococcota bacterium]
MLLFILAACSKEAPEVQDTGSLCVTQTWYLDEDGDGFGALAVEACPGQEPEGAVDNDLDCDDSDSSIHPDAAEICDGLDQNCDGEVDEGLETQTWYRDTDGDGWGDSNGPEQLCGASEGWVLQDGDCDDESDAVNPDAAEVCNGIDDDCDGVTDPPSAEGALPWYLDTDGDGYGDGLVGTACEAPSGTADRDGDCDETDSSINPGAAEICLDLVDQNCNGLEDDWREDCDPSTYDGTNEGLCDPSIAAASSALCTSGVAAILGTGGSYSSIQDAIDDAASGDTVSVCPGTHTEDLVISQDLALIGYGEGSSILEPDSGTQPIVTTSGAITLQIADLSVQNGSAGGITGNAIDLCVTRAGFYDNTSTSGGALALSGAGTLSLEDVRFDSNSATSSGGAIDVDGYQIEILDCSFTNNHSDYQAGAIEIDVSASGTIWGSDFDGNTADYEAGALEYAGASSATPGKLILDTCSFTNNDTEYSGGAISLGSWNYPQVVAVDTTFDSNSAGSQGGALAMGSWGGGHFMCVGCDFTDNSSEYSGGGIDLGGWGAPELTLLECAVSGNSSQSGGGMEAGGRASPTGTVVNTSFTENTAVYGDGGASVDGTWTFTNTDWGTGTSDNSPTDINHRTGLGAGESFTCSGGAC